jgi:hypothetical protein
MGLALAVFVARAASEPSWPHPMSLPLLFLAALVWAMELLALPAIIYVARLRAQRSPARQHAPEQTVAVQQRVPQHDP